MLGACKRSKYCIPHQKGELRTWYILKISPTPDSKLVSLKDRGHVIWVERTGAPSGTRNEHVS